MLSDGILVWRRVHRRVGRNMVVFAAAVLLIVPGVSSVQPPAPRYPDLRTLPPSDPLLDWWNSDDGTAHHVLRFSATIWNAGSGPLELRGEASGGRTFAYQRMYDASGGVTERLVGAFVYHEGHHHWHFEHFADYELWQERDYNAWLANGRHGREPRWRGSKTTGQGESYCVRDSNLVQRLPDSPPSEIYSTCDREIQGISVGWGDTYDFFLDDQWIDVGETSLPDGRYVLRVIADPRNLLRESDDGEDADKESAEANAAVTVVQVEGVRAWVPPE
jgi:Lysyl oxidase